MKRLFSFVLLLALAGSARAQYIGNAGLVTVESPKVFNAVNSATLATVVVILFSSLPDSFVACVNRASG